MSPTFQPNHCPELTSWRKITCLTIFPSKQTEQPGPLLGVVPTGRISLTTVLQGWPSEGCGASAVRFIAVLVYRAEPSVNQASCSSAKRSQGAPHETAVSGWEREGRVTAVGSMGIWVM